MMASDHFDEPAPPPAEEPKLKPAERAQRTDAAFREIVEREKRAEDAKTARLKEARLKRHAVKQKNDR